MHIGGSYIITCANIGQEKKIPITKSKENISPKKPGVTPGKKKSGKNLVTPDTIASLQEEISYLWEIYRVEKTYCEAFMDSLSNLQPKMYIQLLAKEIENLYNEKAVIQHIFTSIQKREESVKYIHQMISYLGSNPAGPDIKDQVLLTINK